MNASMYITLEQIVFERRAIYIIQFTTKLLLCQKSIKLQVSIIYYLGIIKLYNSYYILL